MKILLLSGYAYIRGCKQFEKSHSGLGYTIGALLQAWAANPENEVHVLTQSAFTDEITYKEIHMVRKHWWDILKTISPNYIRMWLRDTSSMKPWHPVKLRTLVYYLTGAYAETVMQTLRPDIVSIRGIGFATRPFIKACRRARVPYVVSLHGLHGGSPSSFGDMFHADYIKFETELLQEVAEHKLPITIIATGMRDKILEITHSDAIDGIHIVPNGVDLAALTADPKATGEIREKFGLGYEDKLLICCSTINENKNQMQILRAYMLLPASLQEHLKVIFLGNGPMLAPLREAVSANGLDTRVFTPGRIPKHEIYQYYAAADINILASQNEGFGNSFVEGFVFGLPSVTFPDLYAVPDLYDPAAMVLAAGRQDQDLADAIADAVNTSWDKAYIMAHGKKFSIENMALNYQNIYTQCIADFKNGSYQYEE